MEIRIEEFERLILQKQKLKNELELEQIKNRAAQFKIKKDYVEVKLAENTEVHLRIAKKELIKKDNIIKRLKNKIKLLTKQK